MVHSKSKLSVIHKKILKILLSHTRGTRSNGNSTLVSNKTISDKLRIPLRIVHQNRKFLEERYLELHYDMNIKTLGYRRIEFLISTVKGTTIPIAEKILKVKEAVYVGRTIGQPTIDLRAEIIVKDNGHLLDLMEKIKGMDGVSDVVWTETVHVVGKKGSVPPEIIDIL